MRRLCAEIAGIVVIGCIVVFLASSSGLVDRLRPVPAETRLPQYCHDRELVGFDNASVGGFAYLCLDGRDIEMVAAPERLVPGRAYTAWMLYANDPRLCGDRGCEMLRQDDPQNQWVQARLGDANADNAGTARIATTFKNMRLAQGAQVLVAVVEGGEPRVGAIYERAVRVMLPAGTRLITPPPTLAASALPVDGGAGSIIAHALFTLMMTGEK